MQKRLQIDRAAWLRRDSPAKGARRHVKHASPAFDAARKKAAGVAAPPLRM